MNDQIDIGYIDHFDETFDYSYADEDIAYKQIYEMHHCVRSRKKHSRCGGNIYQNCPPVFAL